jgi:nitrite reductase/ring-hydroxylating ferredoxin subunit
LSTWVHVAEMKDLTRRRKKQVVVDGRPVALFLVGDEVFAIDDVCGHKQRSLSKGTVLDGQVICPGHQWKFDPRTGQAEDQELCQVVFAAQVTEDGHVLIDLAPAVPAAPVPAAVAVGADDPR